MSMGPIAVNLTKKIFLAAPEGSFLVSNCGDMPTTPLVAEIVSSHAEREEQWKRIVKSEADQRLCRVFSREEDYLEWLEDAMKGGVR